MVFFKKITLFELRVAEPVIGVVQEMSKHHWAPGMAVGVMVKGLSYWGVVAHEAEVGHPTTVTSSAMQVRPAPSWINST